MAKVTYKQPQRGFTLVETIVTVAVLSILVGMVAPQFLGFMVKYQQRQEDLILSDIKKGLESLAKQYNRLPDEDASNNDFCGNGAGNVDTAVDANGDNDWYECIAAVTSLSAAAVANDVWGRPRVYIMREITDSFMEEPLTFAYATVHSLGSNGTASNVNRDTGATVVGIALDGVGFADTTDTNWWINAATDAIAQTEFEDLQAGGDDHLLRFADTVIKLKKYHQTVERLKLIGNALEQYSRAKEYDQVVLLDAANPDPYYDPYSDPAVVDAIFYPPSFESAGTESLDEHDATVKADLLSYGPTVVENRDSDDTQRQNRLQDMISLMRVLGLPDSYCCNALEKEPNAVSPQDYTQEQPLFYYSNPRLLTGAGCQPRPTASPFLPALVMQTERACN